MSIFNQVEEMEIANIAIEQTEEIVLTMASIVMENRNLRAEVERLRKVEKEYHQYVADRCRAADEASFNMLRAMLTGIEVGKGDIKSAKEFADM